jgi:hypothetical protein
LSIESQLQPYLNGSDPITWDVVYENIFLKTPYDQDEKKYKPESKNLVDLFKF